MQAPDFSIKTLSEVMETEEIFSAWENLSMAIQILKNACDNRLSELGYHYIANYDGDNAEILSDEVEELFELRDNLENLEDIDV